MKKTRVVVIGIVLFKGKVLLLKRTPTRHASPNKWQPISGFLNENETAEKAAIREVMEETGLDGKIKKVGKVFEVTDDWGRWVILPYLILVTSGKVEIDKNEHSEAVWVKPHDIERYNLVKGVKKDFEAVGIL